MMGAAWIFAFLTGMGPTPAQRRDAYDIEVLLKHGEHEEAAHRLAQASLPPELAHALRGRVALATGDVTQAERLFALAHALSPNNLVVTTLWAHALLACGQAKQAYDALVEVPLAQRQAFAALSLVRAAVEDALAQPQAAYATLLAARTRWPNDAAVVRALLMLAISHGQLQAARQWVREAAAGTLDAATVAELLAALPRSGSSVALARDLAMLAPRDAQVQGQLGWLLSGAGNTQAALRAFERATLHGADFAVAAADHARFLGATARALRWNARVLEKVPAMVQRMDILIEAGDYPRACGTGEDLALLDALSSRQRYALAYAYASLGQRESATLHARALERTALAGAAAALQSALEHDGEL